MGADTQRITLTGLRGAHAAEDAHIASEVVQAVLKKASLEQLSFVKGNRFVSKASGGVGTLAEEGDVNCWR